MRLGYNSLTYGAQKIREYEKETGYHVPWTLVFDLRQETDNKLSASEISDILLQGETIGIYCVMLMVNQNQFFLEELIEMMSAHKDSASFIFALPEAITHASADAIIKSGNIAVVLATPTDDDKQSFMEAAGILMEKKCLYGAYICYGDHNFEQAVKTTYSPELEDTHCYFVFLINEGLTIANNKKHFSHIIQRSKSANEYPFFLFDLYEGLAHVARTISGVDCFLAIKSTGELAVKNMTEQHQCINIRNYSLQTILEKTMPKISIYKQN